MHAEVTGEGTDGHPHLAVTCTRVCGSAGHELEAAGEKAMAEALSRSPQFDFIHIETIASRSSIHDWMIRAHRHRNLFQILLIERGGGEIPHAAP